MSFSSVDGGFFKPAAPTTQKPPVVTDSYGPVPTPTGSKNVPGLGPVPTFNNAPIAPPQVLPPDYHGQVPGGYVSFDGSTPPPVTGAGAYGVQAPQMPTIDFNALLQKALANMGYANIDSSLQKAREQLIARFGDPTLASMAGFGIDSQAGAYAQQNYLAGTADLARLDRARTKARQGVINQNAAHGLLFSGNTGAGLNEAEQAYGNARYDLTQQYLQQLQALLDQSLQQKAALRQNVINSLLSAFGQYVSDPSQLIGLYG